MTDGEFEEFVAESTQYLIAQNETCEQRFKISSYERFDIDQATEQLVWSDAGVPKVVARIQFVGSISTKTNTWLWSWENASIWPGMKSKIQAIRKFGEEKGVRKLTEAKWPAEEIDGWEMTAVAARLLDAKGGYRAPDESKFTFLIYTDIDWANAKNLTPYNIWPFEQRPNSAVISVRAIVRENAPILSVYHNADDHGWQFLTLDHPRVEDGMVVCLSEIIDRDSSLLELADLPPGWRAWRKTVIDPWIREVNPHSDSDV